MTLPRLDEVTAVMRTDLVAEADSGFARLRRIPSSGTIRFLDYFSSLAPAERSSLLDSHARAAAMTFCPTVAGYDSILELVNTDPALVAQHKALSSPWYSMGLRYEGLRMRKAMMSDAMSVEMMAKTRASLDFTPRDDMPPELVADPDLANVKPAKAPQMRKLIEAAFKKLFAPQKRKLAGGSTAYTGVLLGAETTVWIDYAGMGMQLLHGVSIPDEMRRVLVARLTYESLWGAGRGWDYITEENAEASMQLLYELIVNVVRLRCQVLDLIGAGDAGPA